MTDEAPFQMRWVNNAEERRWMNSLAMLMVGAMAVIRYAQRNSARRPWLVQLMGGRPAKVAAIALANKTARTVWALMTRGERYRDPQAIPAAVSANGMETPD